MSNFIYPYINDAFPNLQYDAKRIVVFNYDIEVYSKDEFPQPGQANHPVTAITARVGNDIYVLGYQDYEPKASNVTYIKCADEKHLLLEFLLLFKRIDPDVITGWNIDIFDTPYIINRMKKLLPTRVHELSPWGKFIPKRIFASEDEEADTYDIVGIESLDYISLYKKFRLKNRESYRLDYIAHVELNMRKLDYSEFASLQKLYEEDYEKYIDYNIQDTNLVHELNAKLGYIEMVYAIAYDAKVFYKDALGSVGLWDVIIHNYLMEKKIVVPASKPSGGKTRQIVGGYVKDVTPGMYEWVVSFDLTSLYPHLIMQYNISPETFIGVCDPLDMPDDAASSVDKILNGFVDDAQARTLRERNTALTAGGAMFRRDVRGFLPALMDKTFRTRKMHKDAMLEYEKELVAIEDEMKSRGMDVALYKSN